MFNTKLIKTKEEIIQLLNDLEVPITVSQLIIDDIKHSIDMQVEQVLKEEQLQYED